MNIKRVKQGAKITLYNGIYMILLGIFYMFSIGINMKYNFEAISLIWQLFIKYNESITHLFTLLGIITGILLISNGIFLIYLSYFIIKRKEKTPWVILFIAGIISWAGLLTLSILIGNPLLIALMFIGWISFTIGMLIPIKYYLEKSYREY